MERKERVVGNRIMMEGLEERRLLSGVTLVTHGYQSGNSPEAWLGELTNDVANRIGSATRYNLHIASDIDGAWVDSFNWVGGPALLGSASQEVVVYVDWVAASDVSFVPEYAEYSTQDLAPLIAEYLFAASPTDGVSHPLAEGPIHLIGHSRGASLMSAVSRELAKDGIWVDQLTTLDPRPVNPDPNVTVPENVLFADNYYQQNITIPTGSPVSGAHNVNLTGVVGAGNGTSHSHVHAFYDGTVDLAATSDGDGISINGNWYQYAGTGPRDTIGFRWSRKLGGGRPSDGSRFSGAYREPAIPTAVGPNVWDNVTILNFQSASSVVRGGTVSINSRFSDLNGDATLTVGFDADTNPHNTGAQPLAAVSTKNALATNLGSWLPTLSTSSLTPGTYRVFAKITNGIHTRYYYAPGAVTITPETTPPTASASVSNVSGAGGTSHSFDVTYSDNIGIKRSTIDGNDIRVTGPGGFSTLAAFVGINPAGDGTPRTATYKFTPPGGSWNSGDNGTYTLTLLANQVTDTSGNAANSGALKTFSVNVPPPSDVARPTAVAAVGNVTAAGGTNYPFTVTYSDVIAVKRSTIDSLDIRITGPNGFNALASLKSISGAGDSSSLVATYQFTPPGGSWNSADNGTYTLALVGSQVSNTSGYFANAVGSLKTFLVSIVTTPPSTGRISGAVFIDKNGDGIQNRGDKGTTGWTLWLDLDKDGVRDSGETVGTDSFGSFAFNNVAPGTYVLRLLKRTGWFATTRVKYTLTLTAGQILKGIAFGQKQ